MAKKSNVVWIGAIAIIAVLTAVELISSRDDDNIVDLTDSTALPFSDTTSALPKQDVERIEVESTEPLETESYPSILSGLEPDTNATSELTHDLIVDLNDSESDILTVTQNPIDKTEINAEDIAKTSDHRGPIGADDATTEEPIAKVEIDGVTPTHPIEEAFVDTPPLTAETNEEPLSQLSEQLSIEQHLSAAEQAIQELRMTTPVGNNAYEHYQAVLTAEPDNDEAQAGIQRIVEMYIYFIEKAIADDQLETAKMYLQRAENIQPNTPKLKSLRTEID